MNYRLLLSTGLTSLMLSLSACSQDTPIPATPKPSHDASHEVEFTVKVENISGSSELSTNLSPLVWQVGSQALFTLNQPAGANLERLAEDGNPDPLLQSLTESLKGKLASALAAGQSASFTFKAKPGVKLSFATMFGQSNDLFIGPANGSISLFDAQNEPVAPTDLSVAIYDAGTEVNQEPGKGADQAPRQAQPNTGTAESQNVRLLSSINDGFTYPAVNQLIRVSLSHNHEHDDHADHDDHEHEH